MIRIDEKFNKVIKEELTSPESVKEEPVKYSEPVTEHINFLEEYTEDSEIPQWFVDAIEELDWSCKDAGSNVELENWSPAGEDLIIYVDKGQWVADLFDNYENFDTAEHVKFLLDAKAHGFRGVPDEEVLVEDAKEILLMYKELADKVAEAARTAENGEEPTIEEAFDSDFSEDEDETLILGRYIDVEIPDLLQEINTAWDAHIYDAGSTRRALNDIRIAYNKLSNAYQELLEGQK